jgi:hypothetical protein
LRTIALALAAAGEHAAAIQVMGFQAVLEHEVPEKLAAGERALAAIARPRRKRAS